MFIRLQASLRGSPAPTIINIASIQHIRAYHDEDEDEDEHQCWVTLTNGDMFVVGYTFDEVVALVERAAGDIPSLTKEGDDIAGFCIAG